jgi:hypothetical protein
MSEYFHEIQIFFWHSVTPNRYSLEEPSVKKYNSLLCVVPTCNGWLVPLSKANTVIDPKLFKDDENLFTILMKHGVYLFDERLSEACCKACLPLLAQGMRHVKSNPKFSPGCCLQQLSHFLTQSSATCTLSDFRRGP